MEIVQIVLIVLIVILLGALIVLIRTQTRLSELSKQFPNAQSIDALGKRIQDVDDSSRKSFERLSGTLGELSKATEHMMEVGKTISSIEDLLKPPKLRGGLGETLLEQLLAQILPPQHYQLQYAFRGGEVVDAVIRLGERLVPVDSKFPMESFRRLISDDDEQPEKKDRKEFTRTMKQHIDQIAQKYILPDEGTYDFALMYIPAENIYYETVIKEEQGDELYPYAMEKRVIPVSPNSFYAYLQVIVYGLKGMHIEEKAKAIMNQLARLKGDEEKFREEFDTLGTHLKNARNKFDEAERKLARFEDKMLEVSTAQPAELPPGEENPTTKNGG